MRRIKPGKSKRLCIFMDKLVISHRVGTALAFKEDRFIFNTQL